MCHENDSNHLLNISSWMLSSFSLVCTPISREKSTSFSDRTWANSCHVDCSQIFLNMDCCGCGEGILQPDCQFQLCGSCCVKRESEVTCELKEHRLERTKKFIDEAIRKVSFHTNRLRSSFLDFYASFLKNLYKFFSVILIFFLCFRLNLIF